MPLLSPDVHKLLRRGRKLALVTAGVTVAGQVTLGAAIMVADALRKQRDYAEDKVPEHPPRIADVDGNELKTYTFGRHLYDDMVKAIDEARDFVYLASYMWKGDEVGQALKDAVLRAAERGVLVCIVYDGFANLVVPREFKSFPDSIHVMPFPVMRTAIPIIDIRSTGRDHRKILVVDGRVGFVGGYNIGSLYAESWRDTHLRVTGLAVWELQNAFVDFWNRHRGPRARLPELPDSGIQRWNSTIHAARNEPSRVIYPVRGLYLEAIDRAAQRVWITQGYFIPDPEIKNAVLAAAGRGVDVRVILPERSNHVLADLVAQAYFDDLLEGGVRLFHYRDVMVHAKTMTVDGQWSTIGTANIDRLSLQGNYEINLEIIDPDQASLMEQIFVTDLENCDEVTLEQWRQRAWYRKGVERFLRPLQVML
ncbi:phospholipase D-like domain-containing protein [Ornithinimicrobium sufpigmenti]|uniref:phospholipase D-like domain-containing protein n=1 Tax=Ornithinimicrobium sufpigmenti TaxID=2508882 RepID=UPI0010369C45|nr:MULTISPECIES: phospholipase D-like domain-containing protein [unclassified Ornithinimicrobium]